jgi:hypothetical protein
LEPQQLATKVAQLESRVATLEDEGKIVKGEVKQILTEIRSAILVRDNPFEGEAFARGGAPTQVSVVTAPAPAKLELVLPGKSDEPDAAPLPEPAPVRHAEPPSPPMALREPVILRPEPPTTPVRDVPQWSLLTISSLAAWAEDAMRRLGPLRTEILLDLCEAAGHFSHEARTALNRITELDVEEPAIPPSTNETAAMLRQLDALINGDDEQRGARVSARL